MKTSKPVKALCISIVLMLLSCLATMAIQTDFGGVTVTEIN